jgi:hypothetical protein
MTVVGEEGLTWQNFLGALEAKPEPNFAPVWLTCLKSLSQHLSQSRRHVPFEIAYIAQLLF